MTIYQVTSSQVRAARRLLGWTVRDLAAAAGIHHNTVNSFETGRYAGKTETLAAIRKALEKAGVQILNHKRPGVRFAPSGDPAVTQTKYKSGPNLPDRL
jgi:transcriptional regulator with XRE-family HTH domain